VSSMEDVNSALEICVQIRNVIEQFSGKYLLAGQIALIMLLPTSFYRNWVFINKRIVSNRQEIA
jgi:Sec-independent protein secretion pathway component TatC